jgi:hypothetical protein
MAMTPKNQDSSETPAPSSPDARLQMRRQMGESSQVDYFGWTRAALQRGVAIASFAFVFIGLEKFVPATSEAIESRISAVGMAFMDWLKIF